MLQMYRFIATESITSEQKWQPPQRHRANRQISTQNAGKLLSAKFRILVISDRSLL